MLANNDNVVLAARQAARLAEVPVQVVPSSSLQAGLGSMLAYDSAGRRRDERRGHAGRGGRRGHRRGHRSRLAGRQRRRPRIERGAYLGLADGEPIAGGTSFDTVANAVVDRLLGEPRDVLTFITGQEEPSSGPLLARVAERHPDLELEVHPAASRTIRCCCRPSRRG